MADRDLNTVEGILRLRQRLHDCRERVFSGTLSQPELRLEQERLSLLSEKLAALEAPSEPPPPPPIVGPEVKPEQAAARAAAIRARPEFWNPHLLDAQGLPVVTREEHAALVRELTELDARAAAAPAGGGEE